MDEKGEQVNQGGYGKEGEMSWTTRLPTKAGWYRVILIGRINSEIVNVEMARDKLRAYRAGFSETYELDEFEWGGEVPDPGTTWTVDEIDSWRIDAVKMECKLNKSICADDPEHGIKAVTERG